jgi:BlaI family penicillinase repressor
MRPATNWADNTVRTLLSRLVEKKALRARVNAGGTRVYLPAVTREACVGAESASFIERIFRGASKPLLVHFAQKARLTRTEVAELKRLLDQSIDDNP